MVQFGQPITAPREINWICRLRCGAIAMASERRILIYRGRVQGVGFRWQAVRAVEGLARTDLLQHGAGGSSRCRALGGVCLPHRC